MKITADSKISDLQKEYPFLEDYLITIDPRLDMLKEQRDRATIQSASEISGIALPNLVQTIAAEIEKQTGRRPETDYTEPAPPLTREQRMETLKSIIQSLHEGGDVEEAKRRFTETVGDIEPTEIAAIEEELIRGGLPVTEVQRLCDVHIGTVRQALDKQGGAATPPGHPVHTYIEENKIIAKLADQLAAVGENVEAAQPILDQLAGIDNHYQRKELQLFSFLERHGITGPTQVMWGTDDQIRDQLKTVREAAERGDKEQFAKEVPALVRNIAEMIYKEENILFPMALETLDQNEWAEIRKGEDDLGYALAKPAADWPGYETTCAEPIKAPEGLIPLTTGALTPEQIDLIITHTPVELSYVNENDTVQFYSEGKERIFPRSPGVIGRKVQKCHPPESVHVVQTIIDAFHSGEKDTAEFWLEQNGRFIYIRYIAVRDRENTYRGCLEVVQDVTEIRALKGERRLLDWKKGA